MEHGRLKTRDHKRDKITGTQRASNADWRMGSERRLLLRTCPQLAEAPLKASRAAGRVGRLTLRPMGQTATCSCCKRHHTDTLPITRQHPQLGPPRGTCFAVKSVICSMASITNASFVRAASAGVDVLKIASGK